MKFWILFFYQVRILGENVNRGLGKSRFTVPMENNNIIMFLVLKIVNLLFCPILYLEAK